MRTVICVLKTGLWATGIGNRVVNYGPKHVHFVRRQVAEFAPGAPFVCLSNVKVPGVETIAMQHDWPGWWSKIELFRLDMGPLLYLDLDVVLTGSLDALMEYPHEFTAMRKGTLNSSVMLWTGARPDIYEPFVADPRKWIRDCRTKRCWGDQGFIEKHVTRWDSLGDLFPGAAASWKLDLKRGKPKADTRIVAFHGTPKPWESRQEWVPCLT